MAAAQGALSPYRGVLTLHSKVVTPGPVTLREGEYRALAAPGAASAVAVRLTDKVAFGGPGGDTAAIVVQSSLGGSGTFYELALLSRRAEGWVNTDTVLLGDRVRVRAVAIEESVVTVDLLTHGPGEPLCCPTAETRRRFEIRGGRLAAADAPIQGVVWQWEETRYNDGRRVAPAKLDHYTVRFGEAGKLDVRADCNRKGGTYTLEGKQLAIKILLSTMVACEPGSLEDAFTRDLAAGAVLFLRNGDLYIDLKYDTGTMRFAAQPPG
jgi:heat shock protein HslJ